MIRINNVSKIYPIFDSKVKKNIFSKIFLNKTGEKKALENVTFDVAEGEFIGLLGPNGAGKSSLIKLLSGVMAPTEGDIRICGLNPIKDRRRHAHNIGVLFGQKTQLWWDLPLYYSLKLLGEIYHIPKVKLNNKLDDLAELIDLKGFLHRPVRQLSLGERMRGEIAATLIHEPPILFLDEPTIGLDVVSKFNIQNLLNQINSKLKTTVILTTHNVDDIEKLCKRVVFINNGQMIYDNSIDELKRVSSQKKFISIETDEEISEKASITWEKKEGKRYWFPLYEDKEIYRIFSDLQTNEIMVKSFTVHEPQLEEIIRHLYLENKTTA